MATVPPANELGTRILRCYSEHGVRAGEMLLLQVLNNWWVVTNRWRAEDFQIALRWALDQGYIEQRQASASNAFFLTDAGFAVI